MDNVPHNEDGVGGMHLYMPWWLDNKKLDFPRGYHIEVGGGARHAGRPASCGGIQRFNGVGGYGKKLKDDYRRYYGATIGLRRPRRDDPERGHATARSIPNVVDKCGIPVLRFHWKWSDHEIQPGEAHAGDLPRDHRRDGRHAARRRCRRREQGYGLAAGGRIIHEVGGTRMGNDPKTSVLNANCQAHDVKNLFVADGGPFVSQGRQELHVDDPRAGDAHAPSTSREERKQGTL